MQDIYIHYGSTFFDINKFVAIKNIEYMNKPRGGLWASPVNAEFGWKDWCESNGFVECSKNNSFSFTLDLSSNIYQINSKSDIENMPRYKIDDRLLHINNSNIDFEKMAQDGVDAVLFNLSSDYRMYHDLYGWDCDSILILNPNVIENII